MRFVNASPLGITKVDGDGHITHTNTQAREIFRASQEEPTSLTHSDTQFRIEDLEGNQIPDKELPFQGILATGKPITNPRLLPSYTKG